MMTQEQSGGRPQWEARAGGMCSWILRIANTAIWHEKAEGDHLLQWTPTRVVLPILRWQCMLSSSNQCRPLVLPINVVSPRQEGVTLDGHLISADWQRRSPNLLPISCRAFLFLFFLLCRRLSTTSDLFGVTKCGTHIPLPITTEHFEKNTQWETEMHRSK